MNLFMKKIILSAAAFCLLALTASAQNRSRTFDNFDTTNGVQVVVKPTLPPNPPAKTTTKKTKTGDKRLVRSTVQQTMNVQDGLAAKSAPYTKMTMGSGTALKGFTTGSLEIDTYLIDSSKRYGIDFLLM